MSQKTWDLRYLSQAHLISSWSKDPSTKVGAVIVSPRNIPIGQGFNGFPRGVKDSKERLDDRETKYAMVVHAESNALLFAEASCEGATLYVWPFMPCSSCAGKAIQKGIKRVVTVETPPDLEARWGKSLEITRTMFQEAGVTLVVVPLQDFSDFIRDNR